MVEDASLIVKEADPVDLIVDDVFLLDFYSDSEILNYPPADGKTSYASKRLDFYFKNNYIVRSGYTYGLLSYLTYSELRIILKEKSLTTKGYKAAKESGSFNGTINDFIIKRIRENSTEEELKLYLKERFLLTPKGQKVLDDNWMFIDNKWNDFNYTNEFIARFLWDVRAEKKSYTEEELEDLLDDNGENDIYTDPFKMYKTLSGRKEKCYTTPLYTKLSEAPTPLPTSTTEEEPNSPTEENNGCAKIILMFIVIFIIGKIIF